MPDLDTILPIAEALDRAAGDDPRLATLELRDVIRHVPGNRAILRVGFEGRDAVLRLSFTPEDGGIAREWDEMRRLWPYMAEGRYRIAEPLHACPAQGVLIVAEAPGTPLMKALRDRVPGARGAILPEVAGWLRQATAMTEGWRIASPDGWLRRAQAAHARQPFAELRAQEVPILAALERLAPQIADAQWRTAVSHGDFHPNNLISRDDTLTGIDIGGSRRMPIYKDMARFLAHLGRRRVTLGGPLCLGVARAGLVAFADAFALDEVERDVFLPFMIAVEALIRVEIEDLPSSRIKRAGAMYRDLAADLDRAGRGTPIF